MCNKKNENEPIIFEEKKRLESRVACWLWPGLISFIEPGLEVLHKTKEPSNTGFDTHSSRVGIKFFLFSRRDFQGSKVPYKHTNEISQSALCPFLVGCQVCEVPLNPSQITFGLLLFQMAFFLG